MNLNESYKFNLKIIKATGGTQIIIEGGRYVDFHLITYFNLINFFILITLSKDPYLDLKEESQAYFEIQLVNIDEFPNYFVKQSNIFGFSLKEIVSFLPAIRQQINSMLNKGA
jgi:hypothetical protein